MSEPDEMASVELKKLWDLLTREIVLHSAQEKIGDQVQRAINSAVSEERERCAGVFDEYLGAEWTEPNAFINRLLGEIHDEIRALPTEPKTP